MDIFLTKTHQFATVDFSHPPKPCEAHFITDACALFDYFWTVENTHLLPFKRLKEQGKNVYNSDWIGLKEESH